MENRSILDQFPFQFRCINQISVMCKCKSSLYIRQNKGLCILCNRSSCCGISYMTNTNISLIFTDNILSENLTYKSQLLMKLHISTLSLSIRNCKSAGFLSSVLQGSQSIIYGRNYIAAIQIINSKDAALFFYSSHLISSDRILLSDFNFTFKTRRHCFLMFGGFQIQIIIIETNLSTYPFFAISQKFFLNFFKKSA